MAKVLDCKEMGLACDYVACARTDKEAIQNLGEHIQSVHAMRGFSRDFYRKAYASIREGMCEKE